MAAISCEPRIEEAEVVVTVNIKTGMIDDYEITGTLRDATRAWSYPYTQENFTRSTTVFDSDDNQHDSIEQYIRVNAREV